MTVIYVDTLFLLNAVVDYLLLLAAARLAGEPLYRWRFGLSAALGGGYAVALFLPGCAFLAQPACRAAAAALMVVVAYGGSGRLLRQVLIFLVLTCAFGGGVFALGLLGGESLAFDSKGVFYSTLDLKMVLFSAAVCYVVISVVFQRVGKHSCLSDELVVVSFELGERAVKLTALVDTGNTLDDPVTGQSVIVAEGAYLASLFPQEYRPGPEELRDPAGAAARLWEGPWKRRFRLLPYRAVGIERGLLLAARMDRVVLRGVDYGPRLVALSPTPLSDGGGYRALVGQMERC